MKGNLFKTFLQFSFFAVIASSALFLSKSPIYAANIVINEILANPNLEERDWIEIYNPTESPVDLSNYYFDDDDVLLIAGQIQKGTSDPGSDPQKLSGILPSHSTCFWDANNSLNKSGDKPSLFLAENGALVDSYQYIDAELNKSFARIPDGGEWQSNQIPSKSSNDCSTLAPTPTFTPVPTFTPTPTLKPTPTQKPTSTPKPTPTIKFTSTPTYKVSSSPSKILLAKDGSKTNLKSENQNLPKEILGENIKSTSSVSLFPSTTNRPSPKKEVKVLASAQNNISRILIGLGSLFIISCGILAFRAYKKSRMD